MDGNRKRPLKTTDVLLWMLCLTGGVAGDKKCFDQFNSQGVINGHCGLDSHRNYIPCEKEYVLFINNKHKSGSCEVLQSAFIILNVSSFFFGYCCRHVMCGMLQCQMGSDHPIVSGMDHLYSRTLISIQKRQFECKYVVTIPSTRLCLLVNSSTLSHWQSSQVHMTNQLIQLELLVF